MSPYDGYKKDVPACTQWLSRHGYFGTLRGTGGNVSVCIPGAQAIVVTPSMRLPMTSQDLTPFLVTPTLDAIAGAVAAVAGDPIGRR